MLPVLYYVLMSTKPDSNERMEYSTLHQNALVTGDTLTFSLHQPSALWQRIVMEDNHNKCSSFKSLETLLDELWDLGVLIWSRLLTKTNISGCSCMKRNVFTKSLRLIMTMLSSWGKTWSDPLHLNHSPFCIVILEEPND